VAKEYHNQIVGLIRFSFVTTGDFYPGFDTVEAMKAFLFDPERLERRFRLFEGICLPALAGQSDRNFTCIFLVAKDLPAEWRKRLDALIAPLPFVTVVEKPPMNHYLGITEAFESLPTKGFTHRTTFRLDDDDAVDLDYIARLRKLAQKVHKIPQKNEPVGIAFNRGLYLSYGKGSTEYYRATERTPLSVGAALVAPVDFPKHIYAYNHRALAQYHDCWADQSDFTFLRTLHQDNKSNPHFSGSRELLDDARAGQLLRAKFGLDRGALDRLMLGA